jgi:hypothetical protein
MNTNQLAERLREVIRAGLVQDARAWCEAAGLSGGFLSSFFVRAKAKPDASISADNATALASVAGVRPAWLLTGEGPRERHPEPVELDGDPRIAEVGAALGAPAHVIRAAQDLRGARGTAGLSDEDIRGMLRSLAAADELAQLKAVGGLQRGAPVEIVDDELRPRPRRR